MGRTPFFDNAKFILVFLVVFGHLIEPLIENSPCLLYTSPSPRDLDLSRMPSSA